MRKTSMIVCAAAVVLLSTMTAVGAPARPRPGIRPAVPGKRVPKKQWNEAEQVFVAKLDRVDAGPVGQSFPPLYSHALHFTVEKALRGSLKPGDAVSCSHSARQHARPVFPVGKTCLVAASQSRGRMRAEIIEASTKEKLAEITLACSLPMGWTVEKGKPVSPWAALGTKAWPGGAGAGGKFVCNKTGRPAFLLGAVDFQVEAVPPKKAIKWTNPDGDGEYKITVTNTTNQPIAVPALLSAGGKILWEESLVLLCQKKVYSCPGSRGVSQKVEPAGLGPNESVSTVVNVLRLKGPEWPRGGYRIEFRFCLGEKSRTKSLYYMSRHHDKLRAATSE